jgi:tetratricopeptide (TPR) repeat protein
LNNFYPKLQVVFPKHLGQVSLDSFYRAINKVQRSLIRTDADEVTYNLHVMIRFDLELAMLEGKLAIKDLPAAWNARYQSDLGVAPREQRQARLVEGRIALERHRVGARVDEAEQLARFALELNPNYGRGYIALANSIFVRGDAYLAEAQAHYEEALALPAQPHAAFIAEKAHLGLGQVLLKRYLLAQEVASPYAHEYATEAAGHYQFVIDSIAPQPLPDPARLERLAQAYLGLGELERQQEIATAADRFCRVLALSQNAVTRQLAVEALGKLDVACAGNATAP